MARREGILMNALIPFLAQAAQTNPTTAPGPTGSPAPSMFLLPALFVGMLVFMMVMSRGQKKREREKKQSLLDNLTKNDRVLTIGGIIGTVSSVRDNEVVLKVDETTNAKMVFLKRAIQQVIRNNEEPRLEER